MIDSRLLTPTVFGKYASCANLKIRDLLIHWLFNEERLIVHGIFVHIDIENLYVLYGPYITRFNGQEDSGGRLVRSGA